MEWSRSAPLTTALESTCLVGILWTENKSILFLILLLLVIVNVILRTLSVRGILFLFLLPDAKMSTEVADHGEDQENQSSSKLSSSSTIIPKPPVKRTASVYDYDPSELPELLKDYYKRLFPYNHFYRWLNYGHTEDTRESRRFFQLREFCFTLKDDVYLRYKSFENQKEFEQSLQAYCPYKIDIGPVYSARVKDVK